MNLQSEKTAGFLYLLTTLRGSNGESERVGGSKPACLYEELLRAWSLPDKGMKTPQQPSAARD